jgi:tetratricopeptide (TPR) repeat protein
MNLDPVSVPSARNDANIQALYDASRFLDAYEQTKSYWDRSTDLTRLSTQQMILAGRLANRLGGARLCRWLFYNAYKREPHDPRVRYFTRTHRLCLRDRYFWDEVRRLEDEPLLGTGDMQLEASWLAYQAVTWAMLRDFSRATACLERAQSYSPADGWVESCESTVWGMADRREDALLAAERSWKLSNAAPYSVQSLGLSLLNLGRVSEAASRVTERTEDCQSYEIVHFTCWLHCALAERCEGKERLRVLAGARDLADRLPGFAPLADRETRASFAHTHLDIANLSGDREEMETWAGKTRSTFYRKVLENLRRNSASERIRLPHLPILQKYQTCLPTSIASVLVSQNVTIDPENMAREITFGGTPTWAAAEWLEKRGFAVRFFKVTPEIARRLIENGVAFVLSLESDESSHAVAVIGIDEGSETLFVHDPSVFRFSEYLFEGIQQMSGPLEPVGMAIVLQTNADFLDGLLFDANAEVMTASQNYQREVQLKGITAAREVMSRLSRQYPDDPAVRFLQAEQRSREGRSGDALAGFQESLKAFPHSVIARRHVLQACRSMGNTALSRQLLKSVVEGGLLPGIESQQNWRRPPSAYVCAYGDLLRLSASTRAKAKSHFKSVLVRDPTHAETWHCLGDLLEEEGDTAGLLLCYRISSCLNERNEHYALAYSDALCDAGKKEEGFAWLESRLHQAGPMSAASSPWVSWMLALEHWGYPERALAVCGEALQRFSSAPEFLVCVIPFLVRMGQWKEAEGKLHDLELSGSFSMFCEAARDFHGMRGEFEQAIHYAEERVKEAPLSLSARTQLLDLVAKYRGNSAASAMAEQWVHEHPGHDDFEQLYCDRLNITGPRWRKDRVLHRRVKRNPEDGWAWRELALQRISDYARSGERRGARLRPRIEHLLAQCDRTAPESPSTICVYGLWSEACGDWVGAINTWQRAIEADSGSLFSYRHLWDCSARLGDTERGEIFRQMEPKLLRYPAHLSFASSICFLLAQRFGFVAAEEISKRWIGQRPDDPEVALAHAELLLECGHGKSDSARAKSILEPAIARFPYHTGLRFSLAKMCKQTAEYDQADQLLQEIIRRHPDDTAALIQMALLMERRGLEGDALRALETALARSPLDEEVWNARIEMHIRRGRIAEARTEIHDGLQRSPQSVTWRQRAIHLLMDCGAEEHALAVAREGVRLFPAGAYMWLLLAKTLQNASRLASQGEIEFCLRRSLSLNATLFETADNLALLLMEQHRFEAAAEIIQSILPRMDDPSPARGRLASIHRQNGHKSNALDELASIIREAPWYYWGWILLMDWLVEDSAWEKARQLLAVIPPELRANSDLRQKRLQVLRKARVPVEQLRFEWEELLRDFPENIPLHLECYDQFRADRVFADAARVLKAVRLLDPDNPFMLARMVEVVAEDGDYNQAADILLRIWFQETEKGPWPADFAWTMARRYRFDQATYAKARLKLAYGSRLAPQAFALMAQEAALRENKPKNEPKSFWDNLFPSSGARELSCLLKFIDGTEWADGRYRGVALGLLVDHGYHHRVIWYWNKNQGKIDREAESWSQIARSLVSLNRKEEARSLLAKWREQKGVAMWMVTNYISCFSRTDQRSWNEVLSTCKDALAGMQHDHCAKYLAHVQAEIFAAQGNVNGFRETWKTYRVYFTGQRYDSEWFDATRIHLLKDIPEMALLLEQDQSNKFLEKCVELRRKQALEPPSPVKSGNIGFSNSWWWILIIWLLLSLIAQSFH